MGMSCVWMKDICMDEEYKCGWMKCVWMKGINVDERDECETIYECNKKDVWEYLYKK